MHLQKELPFLYFFALTFTNLLKYIGKHGFIETFFQHYLVLFLQLRLLTLSFELTIALRHLYSPLLSSLFLLFVLQ